MTSHINTVRLSDLTNVTAITTPTQPKMVMAIEGIRAYSFFLINSAAAIGIVEAHEDIMIGNATIGFIPRR